MYTNVYIEVYIEYSRERRY